MLFYPEERLERLAAQLIAAGLCGKP